ncbi:MAG: (d)CMP kinase [Ruminococcaceae bacterium]|nr:(d)CMP kinase [Oscillospiraceae bacterium]
MIIAIDGPSGAGKSTLAKNIAKKLGIVYVDTGALYRTIGLYVYNKGISKDESEKIVAALNEINIKLDFVCGAQKVLLNGVDVGDSIRTQNIAAYASAVSAIIEVRAFLLDTQRNIAKENSIVMDGRDIGTVIFPNADVKIFLTANDVSRAERRFAELAEKGTVTTFEKVLEEMRERDHNDSTRKTAPAIPADDSILLDNSGMTLEETEQAALEIIKSKLGNI